MKPKILLLILSLSFFACNKVKESDYVGKWVSTKRPIPYKAYLTINFNHTFTYKGGACESLFGAEGKWKINNDTLILESNNVDRKYCIDEFDQSNSKIVRFVKPGEETEDKVECKLEKGRSYINFRSEKFYFENDTLKHKPKKINDIWQHDLVISD